MNCWMLRKMYGSQFKEYGSIDYLVKKDGRDENLQQVFSYIEEMYDHELFPENWKQVVYKAAGILWELNIIFFDRWGFYSGHIVTIPTKTTDLVSLDNEDLLLTMDRIKERPWRSEPIILHMFSTFCTYSNYLYFLLRRVAKFIHNNVDVQINSRSQISAYPTTDHSREMVMKFGLTAIGQEAYKKQKHAHTIHRPRIYAATLEDIDELIRVE